LPNAVGEWNHGKTSCTSGVGDIMSIHRTQYRLALDCESKQRASKRGAN
jgi:hypothetical protein